MKVPSKPAANVGTVTHHSWGTVLCVMLGFGILALAVFWIKKCKVARRAHSAAEFSHGALEAARKRAAFGTRSQSSEQKEEDAARTPQRSESFAKALFCKRSSSVPRHEYSALRSDSTERHQDGAFSVCKSYLSTNERYELKSHLGSVGSRTEKQWFVVQDNSLGADRLMTVVPLPSSCPLPPSLPTRDTLIALFRGLQHPYIHPVLDIEFWDAEVALITPLNPIGSLRDLIYGCSWQQDYEKKYNCRGTGLPLRQVQCLGRQILEALLFLRNRHFPPFYHLHSGNVIIQNGAARLAGLENVLLGMPPRAPAAPENLGFGYLLFEVTAGYELPSPPSPAHLQLELERTPKVAEVLEVIFQSARTPSLEELICCDLFRGVELRELRGTGGVQSRTPPEVLRLLDMVRNPLPPSPIRRKDVVLLVASRQLEDIIEEDPEDSESITNDDGFSR